MTHLVITDSGLGGLATCALAERALRGADDVRITYFNSWPEEAIGYNDLPDIAVRARVFDRALASMASLRPDRIVIACNTLSIVYERTAFQRRNLVPVLGIVNAGVELFHDALAAEPTSAIVTFGTRTTIESAVHRDRLIAKGIAGERIAPVACHGLAKAIETNPDGEAIAQMIDECTRGAVGHQAVRTAAGRLYLGVCCTHYTYIADELRAALERATGRRVEVLDPTERLVTEIVSGLRGRDVGRQAPNEDNAPVMVTVVSKVPMDDRKRESIARRVEATSPATAAALLAYTRVSDLF